MTRDKIDYEVEPSPFLKWVGSKRQLIPELMKYVGDEPIKGMYVEPFLGGGALFWHLISRGLIRCALLSDINPWLMQTYEEVRDHPVQLMRELDTLAKWGTDSEHYYSVREVSFGVLTPTLCARNFVYLNKLGFNGLYRENSKGGFNVPYGKNPKRVLYDRANLLACSTALNCPGMTVVSQDFAMVMLGANTGCLAYCDPPYIPASPTSSFTTYTANGFGLAQQQELAASALDEVTAQSVVEKK